MQLLSLVLYNADGRIRRLDFVPGALNIVTGESGTGKSALLTIVEYCLGRDTILVPVGPITDTVEWYGALWQLDDAEHGRAFVARPKPAGQNASTSTAMLEFGVHLDVPPFESLRTNIDTKQLRQQLGRHIGIEENQSEPGPWSLRPALEANLGHAALLCLQSQSEIASQSVLFHRMGEPGMDQALKDTIPYFLGAVAPDEALKRTRLRDLKRSLTRLLTEYEQAQLAAKTVNVELQALYSEARAAGLASDVDISDQRALTNALQEARTVRLTGNIGIGPQDQDRRRELEERRDDLAAQLRVLMENRALLLSESKAAGQFVSALEKQQSRLTSLNLLPGNQHRDDGEEDAAIDCPACGSKLNEPDPLPNALYTNLANLQQQVEGLTGTRPVRRQALAELDTTAEDVREQLRGAGIALRNLDRGRQISAETDADNQAFTRGRIDATLARLQLTDEVSFEVLRQQLEQTRTLVEALEGELDDDVRREELTSRLVAVGRDIKAFAARLELEHSAEDVRLDLARLTVVADTPTGPAPLARIGSAKNWVGYHLATHLALHRYLTLQERPVPRFLMLDQPTQAHYPSEKDNETGLPEEDADRRAVRAMFELMRDVVAELSPRLQLIVCDHADLPTDWFQQSVRYRWRNGEALIPTDWIEVSG